MVDIKKLAKLIATTLVELSKEELTELITELDVTYGLKAPEPVIEVVEQTAEVTEQTFNVVLKEVGTKKLQLVRSWKALTGLSLHDSKALMDAAPVTLKEKVSRGEAESYKTELETASAGCVVELQ